MITDTDIDESRAKDKGSPQIKQHHVIEEKNGRVYVRSQVPVDYYLHRGLINQSQHEAAEYLFYIWYHGAEKSSYATMRDPRTPKGIPNHMRREQLEQAYKKAMASIPNMVARLTVLNVVCYGEWLGGLNKQDLLKDSLDTKHYLKTAFGEKKRMDLLRSGLADLQKYFRIPNYKE